MFNCRRRWASTPGGGDEKWQQEAMMSGDTRRRRWASTPGGNDEWWHQGVLLLLFSPPSFHHRSPWQLSYLLMTFRQRPSSFLMSATSWRSTAFSLSKNAARTEIWFSFSLRASLERLAASLFFTRRFQYLSSFCQWWGEGSVWGSKEREEGRGRGD